MDRRQRASKRRTGTTVRRIAVVGLAIACLPAIPATLPGTLPGTLPATAAPPRGACSNPDPGRPLVRSLPWAQDLLGAERAWSHSTGAGVTVAVVDSGVDADHPQLHQAGKVMAGRDFYLVGRLPGNFDCVSHGTAVASIISADPVGGVGFHGIAPGAKILPVRVTDRETGDSSTTRVVDPLVLARGITYAVDQGAKVINLSMAGDRDEKPVRQAIADAVRRDVVVVAAAGNRQADNPDVQPSFPASYPGVLGVGAIDIAGARTSGSQAGPYVDLVAPGEGVLAATRRTGHTYVSGTSFAAPFVSATAALVRSAWPKLTAKQVIQRLQATATPARGGAGSPEYGAGIVDPYRAVTEGLTATGRAIPVATAAPPDQQKLAVQAWWRDAGADARGWTKLAVAVALILLLAGVLLGAGRRRHWLAGRTPVQRPTTKRDPSEPLPEHLFTHKS